MGIHVLIVLIEIHFILVGIAEALDGEAVELDDIPVLQHARHQSDAAADIAHYLPAFPTATPSCAIPHTGEWLLFIFIDESVCATREQ